MAKPEDGDVVELGIEECVAVYSAEAELWTLFTEAEQEGYLGEFDTVEQAKRYARNHYDNL